jgi:hypothetical protein
MDLNGLQFTGEQLAELYTDKLVIAEPVVVNLPSKKIKVHPEKAPILYKGKNKKKVLWIVNETAQAFLDDADFEFLSQIVTACKMNMDDIALVNMAHINTTIADVVEELQASVVLLCGIEYNHLPVKTDEYMIYPFNHQQYFIADSLKELRNDKAKKTKLWLALKAIFSI